MTKITIDEEFSFVTLRWPLGAFADHVRRCRAMGGTLEEQANGWLEKLPPHIVQQIEEHIRDMEGV